MEQCPQELMIPLLLEVYGDPLRPVDGKIPMGSITWLEPDKRPTACIGCRSCESVCPQNIKISELLADFVARLA
jgi:predicted aldo/keto reductase-like oxidoreductase